MCLQELKAGMNPKADKGGKELLHLPQEFFPARKTQKAKTSKKHLHKLISAYSTSGSHWMACLTLVGLGQSILLLQLMLWSS